MWEPSRNHDNRYQERVNYIPFLFTTLCISRMAKIKNLDNFYIVPAGLSRLFENQEKKEKKNDKSKEKIIAFFLLLLLCFSQSIQCRSAST